MNNNKIIFLIGASGSGKSTVENEFIKTDANKLGGFNHIVSHATRKPRLGDGEKDGVDYYFISEEEFDIIHKNNEFIQTITHAGSRKGSSIIEWENKLEKGNIIMPVLLNSAIELKSNLPRIYNDINKNISVIFFDISIEEALDRMVGRYVKEYGLSVGEFKKSYHEYIEEGVDNISNSLMYTFDEIKKRLNDIEMLSPAKSYADYILDVNGGKNIKTVYSEFIDIIEDIFKV